MKYKHTYIKKAANPPIRGSIAFTIDLNGHTFGVYETIYEDTSLFAQLRYLVRRKHSLITYGGRVKLKQLKENNES